MRFCYVVLAAAAMLLVPTSAVTAGAEQNHISQMNPERLERSLRYVDEEERTGFNIKQLSKLIKSKRGPLPFDVEQTLSKAKQEKLVRFLKKQNLNQKEFAKKLGMNSVEDLNHQNAKFFELFKSKFPAN